MRRAGAMTFFVQAITLFLADAILPLLVLLGTLRWPWLWQVRRRQVLPSRHLCSFGCHRHRRRTARACCLPT